MGGSTLDGNRLVTGVHAETLRERAFARRSQDSTIEWSDSLLEKGRYFGFVFTKTAHGLRPFDAWAVCGICRGFNRRSHNVVKATKKKPVRKPYSVAMLKNVAHLHKCFAAKRFIGFLLA